MRILGNFVGVCGYIRLITLVVAGVAASAGSVRGAFGQVVESANVGGLTMSAGGTISAYRVGYGERQLLGYSGFLDVGPREYLGFEAEVRQLAWRQTADVHVKTYLAGPRYPFRKKERFQLYAKALFGDGEFNFPYGYAHGSYLVIAPGAGVDFRLNRRVSWRLVDFEYQWWHGFSYGTLPSYGVSSGFKVHILR